jgi:hypothetical protein
LGARDERENAERDEQTSRSDHSIDSMKEFVLCRLSIILPVLDSDDPNT